MNEFGWAVVGPGGMARREGLVERPLVTHADSLATLCWTDEIRRERSRYLASSATPSTKTQPVSDERENTAVLAIPRYS